MSSLERPYAGSLKRQPTCQANDDRKERQFEVDGGLVFRVIRFNLLTLAAGVVGIVALTTPWSAILSVFGNRYFEPVRLDVLSGVESAFLVQSIALFLFFVGTLIVFVTPLGGLSQAAGVLLFWCDFGYRLLNWDPNFEDRLVAGLGSFIGAASFAIAIASITHPKVISVRGTTNRWRRLLTFNIRNGVESDR